MNLTNKDKIIISLILVIIAVYLATGMRYYWQALAAEGILMIFAFVNIRRKPKEFVRTHMSGANVSEDEAVWLRQQKCPDCDQHGGLWDGPSGGMTVNCICSICGSQFNLGYMNGIDYGARISMSSRDPDYKPPEVLAMIHKQIEEAKRRVAK